MVGVSKAGCDGAGDRSRTLSSIVEGFVAWHQRTSRIYQKTG